MRAAPRQEQAVRSGGLGKLKSGCGWLRICVFLARFCRDLHPEVVDLLEYTDGLIEFETRHSPHFSQLRKLMIKGLVSQ
jgi:hypothetical protein